MHFRPLPLLAALAVVASAHSAAPPPQRFRVEVLAQGMPQPMQLARRPDGRIFFSEIAGVIKVWLPTTGAVEEVGRIPVTTAQENGLIGMAPDPDFAANGWMYFMHSPTNYEGQVISRFTVRDNRLDPASRKELLRWPEQRLECCHHAGTLRFGPDGCLYASTGDNTHPFGDSQSYAPIDERPGREPWDAQKSSANTDDLRGKILRIRPTPGGGYTIPEGNLFPSGTPKTRPEIYAMGLRNPWRFNLDARTGIVYAGDVGPDAGGPNPNRGPRGYDTVNQIRQAANLGWPYVRGGEAYRDFDFATGTPGPAFDPASPVNEGPNSTGLRVLPPVTNPLIWYPSGPTEKFPAVKSGGRTACAGPVFYFDSKFKETGGLPEEYDRCLLFYDWQRPFLLWAKLDANSDLVEILPFTDAVAVRQGGSDASGRVQIKRPVDMSFGDDGCLYLLDYGETWGPNSDSKLLKISYQWGNLHPVAKVSLSPAAGREPLEVALSSEGSLDPDGDTLALRWFLQPGDRPLGEGPSLRTTVREPGSYTVELRATDAHGAESRVSAPLTVGNAPPEVAFATPRDGDFFTPGQAVNFAVTVRDAEDGDAAARPDLAGPRTLVTLRGSAAGAKEPPGFVLMRQSDCFNCHAAEQRVIGPALVEIAAKYRGQAGAEDAAVNRVLKGSSGVWGPLPMLPHPQHSADEIHQMVRWIFEQKSGAGLGLARGLTGALTAPADPATDTVVLEAAHTDTGRGSIPALTGQARVHLRPRRLEAEAGEVKGALILGFGQASGGKGLGGIGHQHRVTFANLPLDQCKTLVARVASAGTGGRIEVHATAPDGPLLAEFEVKPTGGWENWIELTSPLAPSLPRADVHLVFVKPGVGGGMMNLDWVRFDP